MISLGFTDFHYENGRQKIYFFACFDCKILVSWKGCVSLHLAWRLKEKDNDSLGNLGNKMKGGGR
jgi:hypothetical protein